jgi:hypothetical protein
VGLCQRRGGEIEVIRPGDRVFFEPGEDHWHGAAPNRLMTHLAMQQVDGKGSPVEWGEHVGDEEYGAAPSIDGWRGPSRRPEGAKRLEETPTPAEPGRVTTESSYPGDLARFVRHRWKDVSPGGVDPLPDAAALENFFAACYQASMLREEERPVVFRAILAEPTLFDPEGRPPEGLQRLAFPRSLLFDPRELRRLSVASDPQRTLIGVRQDRDGSLRIWGLINSGTRWLRDVYGGRRAGAPLPPAPVVHVNAPGSIEAYKGHELIGKLQRGRLSGSRLDPFESEWLPGRFSQLLEELAQRHKAARNRALELSGEGWAPLESSLPHRITQRMMKRVINVLREAHHGGTVIFIPLENAGEYSSEHPYIDLRYRFSDSLARRSFPDLIVDILNRLAQLYGTADRQESAAVGWR